MRNCIHSIRLAVSLLLGIMFVVSPVVNPVFASKSLSTLPQNPSQLASNYTYCSYDLNMKNRMLYQSLTSLPVTRINPYLPQRIAEAKQSPFEIGKASAEITVPLSPIASPTPTTTISPAPITPTASTPVTTAQAGSQLNSDVLFNLVNAHRASIGLAPFQHDSRVCEVASSRAPELDGEIYGGGGMHAGFYARDLGYWATENMISMPTEEAALNWWLNSPVHRSAIEGNYQFACVGCSGKSCAMIFTNFAPK